MKNQLTVYDIKAMVGASLALIASIYILLKDRNLTDNKNDKMTFASWFRNNNMYASSRKRRQLWGWAGIILSVVGMIVYFM